MGVFTLTMMGAGTLGVPRRHWDITFAGASLPYEFPGTALLMLTLVGISGVIAVIGGAMYIVVAVGTVFFGKRLDAGTYTTQISPLRLPTSAAALEGHGSAGGGFHAPGTFVLALIFLVAFILYYFVNWKYLSTVWGLS
jgi:cytochrome c oxidase subunit 1